MGRFVAIVAIVAVVLGACTFSRTLSESPASDDTMIPPDDAPPGSEPTTSMSSCMPSYTMMNGTSYYRAGSNATWYEAEASCESDGGHLVVIDDATENAFVRTFDPSSNTNDVWIGGSDHRQEDTFRWVTGTTIAQSGTSPYQNWESSEPSNENGSEDCVELNSNGWDDNNCTTKQEYVCECDAKPIAMNPKTYCVTGTSENCNSCGDFCVLGCGSLQVCL